MLDPVEYLADYIGDFAEDDGWLEMDWLIKSFLGGPKLTVDIINDGVKDGRLILSSTGSKIRVA